MSDDLAKRSSRAATTSATAAGRVEAVSLLARTAGIRLDPVDTGRGMAGLIDPIRRSRFRRDENVVFVHAGGSAALSGSMDPFETTLAAQTDTREATTA